MPIARVSFLVAEYRKDKKMCIRDRLEGGAGLSGRTVGVKHGTGGTGQAERAAVQAVIQAAVQAFRSNEESGRTKKDILTKEAKF